MSSPSPRVPPGALVDRADPAGPRLRSAGGRAALADEVEGELRDVLAAWYPRAVDAEAGGFLTRFDYAWRPVGAQRKGVFTQARHVWTTAQAATWAGDEAYAEMALHGATFLREAMWDPAHGGFFWLVERDGTPVPEAGGHLLKRTYGLAFGVFGLAAAYEATGDEAALGLAVEAFRWLDAHAYDPVHGGYFSIATREGRPLREGWRRPRAKDQNASVHVLEALCALYRVWPDATLRGRIGEVLGLIRDTMVVEPGTLRHSFRSDWTPVSSRGPLAWVRGRNPAHDRVSYGHDVEAAHLLLAAADVLGLDPAPTLAVAKRLVDHALRSGWDEPAGGFAEAGHYVPGRDPLPVAVPTKTWWAQAEGLNALLRMGDLFPDAPPRYDDRFLQLWGLVRTHLVDSEHGGWYPGTLDRQPEMRWADKGDTATAAYHVTRALLEVAGRLRRGPAG